MSGKGIPEGAFAEKFTSLPTPHFGARFGLPLERLPVAAYTCDADGLITGFNERAGRLWQREPRRNDPAERYSGTYPIFATDGTLIPLDQCAMARALRTSQQQFDENYIELASGERHFVLSHASPVFDESGTLLGGINLLIDVTGRERAAEALWISEQRFSLFMHNLPGLAWIKDAGGRYVFVNEAAEQAFGIPRTELYGRTDDEIFPPEIAADFRKNDRAALNSRDGVRTFEFLRDPDGVVRQSIVSKFTLPGTLGEPPLVGGIAIDITDRVRAEESVRKISAFREAVIRSAAEGICVCHEKARFPFICFSVWNEQMLEITGYTIEEINRLGWYQTMFPEPNRQVQAQERMARMRSGDNLRNEEWEITRKDGERRTIAISTSIVEIEGSATAVVALMHDTTERRRALRAQTLFRSLLDQINDSIELIDADTGRFLDVNEQACRQHGYSRDEYLSLTVADLDPWLADQPWADIRDGMLREGLRVLESHRRRRDGSTFPVEVSCTAIRADRDYLLAVARDITERKRVENAIRDNENRLRTILDTQPECVKLLAADGSLLEMNAAGLAMIDAESLEEVHGHCVFPLVVPEHRTAYQAVTERVFEGRSERLEFEVVSLRGRRLWMEMHAAPLRDPAGNVTAMLAVTRDITERKRAEEQRRRLESQILQARKMESLGILAGGIAHDFNNLLTSMLGNASLALGELPHDSAAAAMLREIERAAERASDLTRQMLAYAGRGTFVIQPLRLDLLVRELAQLLQTVISRSTRVHLELEPTTIEGDSTQIRQVVMNLITNASDALDGRAGVVVLRTGVRRLDAADLRSPYVPDDLPSGVYAYIEVEDQGRGMDEETVARIFDPFFTTKFTGRGLGLAAALGIVRGHQGSIKVASTLGRGTLFQVYFPCTPAEAATEVRRSAPPSSGQGTILVIEDETGIRDLARRVLEKAGFRVLTAGDGREGIELFRQNRAEIRAVIVDLTMPGVDGAEVLRQIHPQAPELPFLVMSGYSEQEVSSRFTGAGTHRFIQKPFLPRELVEQLFSVLSN